MSEEVKEANAPTNSALPVGDIRIQFGDHFVIFTPTDDITGKECAQLMVMFLNGIMAKSAVDMNSYIAQHNLSKHFTLVANEPKTSEETA